MWDKLAQIHGGDKNVLRDEVKKLRGKFDDMRMKEGEIVAQNSSRIKEVVNAIRGVGGIIFDETIINKVLWTLLPIYAIRISTIQELRCILGNVLTLDSLIGRLTTFELSNFDNYSHVSIECSFKSQLTFNGSKRKNKNRHVDSDSESDNDLEALLERRLPRGK